MKKPSTRIILIAALVIASICSYIYLRQVSLEEPAVTQEEPATGFEEEDLDQSEIILPNVTLVKKVFEVGRRFLP